MDRSICKSLRKLFSHQRKYYVIAIHPTGTTTFTSTVNGFLPFNHVPMGIIKEWGENQSVVIGAKCLVTSFVRIKNEPDQ